MPNKTDVQRQAQSEAEGFHMNVLAVVPKSNSERFLVGLQEYMGRNYCNVRIGIVCRGGEKKMANGGLSIPAVSLPAMRAALERAEIEARARGWLEAA